MCPLGKYHIVINFLVSCSRKLQRWNLQSHQDSDRRRYCSDLMLSIILYELPHLSEYWAEKTGNPLRCGLCTNKEIKKKQSKVGKVELSTPGDKAANYTNMDVTSRRAGLNSFK